VAKTAGLNDRFFVNGYDLSGDVGAIQKMSSTIGEQKVTGLDKLAVERLQLLGDSAIDWSCFFTGQTSDTPLVHAHERLKTLSTTALCTYLNGTTAGDLAVGHEAKQFTYSPNRAADGALLVGVTSKGSGGYGLDVGRILDAAAAPTAVGNGTVLDLGASHGWGSAAFHLHAFSFTGTSVTIIIQTDDNSGMTTPTTYGTFTAVAGRTYQRLAVATAPERYIRWRADSGTFSAVSFAVAAFRTS